MLERFRALSHTLLGPVARLLIKLGVSPDLVTIVGTLGVVLRRADLLPAGLAVAGRGRRDRLRHLRHGRRPDGQDQRHVQQLGRLLGLRPLDRLGDAAVFGGILLYFVYREDSTLWAGIALAGLVFGQWTSYVKARAESLGFTCTGGLAARADRLVIILAGALLAGLGVPYVLQVAVAGLAVTSMITVLQRIMQVRRQAKAAHVRPA